MRPNNDNEIHIQQKLTANSKVVQKYKDPVLKAEALQVIPIEELTINATQRLSLCGDGDGDVSLTDLVLIELLHWFKNSFFSWVDVPECDACGKTTTRDAVDPFPTDADERWGASNVEGYTCSSCGRKVRFPRYNDPRKLMQTRKGRCGEWTNCFTLFCYAMGYEARYVYDFGDHVWTEVFSEGRWLHLDPCEEAFDKPLMYELGWKKKLDYVIAFSVYDVQDVTWRYSVDFDGVCQRRVRFREEWIEHVIGTLTEELQKNLPEEEKRTRQERCLDELIEFLTPGDADATSYSGRTSGSLAWRLSRDETSLVQQHERHVFTLLPEEIRLKRFTVKYSCATDKYIRTFGDESEGWRSWTFEERNVFRKLESDWKMVYLARTEGSDSGHLSWMFDFEQTGVVVDKLKLNLRCETFENGKIVCHIYPNADRNRPVTFEKNELTPLITEGMKGCTSFLISVELSEGIGNVAWQHSQVFRQALDSPLFPFELEVWFEKAAQAEDSSKKGTPSQ